jgi:hypothetical protein
MAKFTKIRSGIGVQSRVLSHCLFWRGVFWVSTPRHLAPFEWQKVVRKSSGWMPIVLLSGPFAVEFDRVAGLCCVHLLRSIFPFPTFSTYIHQVKGVDANSCGHWATQINF